MLVVVLAVARQGDSATVEVWYRVGENGRVWTWSWGSGGRGRLGGAHRRREERCRVRGPQGTLAARAGMLLSAMVWGSCCAG